MKRSNYFKLGLWLCVVLLAGCATNGEPDVAETNTAIAPPLAQIDHEKAARYHVELGVAYLARDDYNRAKQKLHRAMKLAPQLPEVHYAMAHYLERTGEIDKAEREYQAALKLNPRGGAEHNNYGAFLCRQKKFAASEKHFKQALNDPDYLDAAEVLENLGFCHLDNQDTASAKTYFLQALRREPRRPNAMLELGLLEWHYGEPEAAENWLQRYERVADPNARSALLGLQVSGWFDRREAFDRYARLMETQFRGTPEYGIYEKRYAGYRGRNR